MILNIFSIYLISMESHDDDFVFYLCKTSANMAFVELKTNDCLDAAAGGQRVNTDMFVVTG